MTVEIPNTVVVEARAKINLFLRVLGRRSDGYHDLETLIVPIDLSDRLEVHARSDPEQFRTLALSLEVSGDQELIHGVPVDVSNLVMVAARSLADAAGARGFADFILHKSVPAAAGLGGGSADAAATLRALNDLWSCGMDEERLRRVGETVGSDVPALLVGAAAVARGRGELVTPARVRPLELALVTFPFAISTGDAFRWWDEDDATPGPDPAPVVYAAGRGMQEALGGLVYNDLEDVVIRRHPAIGEARQRLLDAGATGVVMCGSGPTLATLIPSDGNFQPPEDLSIRIVRTVSGNGAGA